jgi:hypothetical protein
MRSKMLEKAMILSEFVVLKFRNSFYVKNYLFIVLLKEANQETIPLILT